MSLVTVKNDINLYLNMIRLLKSKFSFGVFDKFSIYMHFCWTDTLNNEYYTSYDINLEYYSVLYNLGGVYCNLGRTINLKSQDTDDNKLKEAIKYFQNAAWIFEKLSHEVLTSVKDNELQPDLNTKNLNMVSNIVL